MKSSVGPSWAPMGFTWRPHEVAIVSQWVLMGPWAHGPPNGPWVPRAFPTGPHRVSYRGSHGVPMGSSPYGLPLPPPWVPIVSMGSPWFPMAQAVPMGPIGVHGSRWVAVAFQRGVSSWVPMGPHAPFRAPHRDPHAWGSHGTPGGPHGSPVGPHGSPWGSHGSPHGPRGLHMPPMASPWMHMAPPMGRHDVEWGPQGFPWAQWAPSMWTPR